MEIFLTLEIRDVLKKIQLAIPKGQLICGFNTKIFIKNILECNSYYTDETSGQMTDQELLNHIRDWYIKYRKLNK